MIKGNITKSADLYTVSIFVDGERKYKESGIYSLQDAQEILAYQKKVVSGNLELRRSYPELEGKVCTGKFKDGDDDIVIIGCDYWIGITACFERSPDNYVMCVRGPGSVHGQKIMKDRPHKFNNYDGFFELVVNMIRSGVVDLMEVHDFKLSPSDRPGKNPNSKNCAFNS